MEALTPKQIKAEKELVKKTLTDLQEFNVWTVQFRKTHYTVNVKYNIPFVKTAENPYPPANYYRNLTAEQQTRLDDLMKTLGLTYPVKIIGGGDKY